MNNEILELFKTIPLAVSAIFVVMSAIISCYTIIGKFSEIVGKPVRWVKDKQKDHELLIKTSQNLHELQKKHEEDVRQSIRHDEMIKDDISSLTNTVNGIANTLNSMQEKENETKLKELKGSLIRYYHKYKDIGEWSKLEKDAFWDLFDDYEARGGDGYIHSIVEPAMRELKEVD